MKGVKLEYCPFCIQMTNHRYGECLKCKKKMYNTIKSRNDDFRFTPKEERGDIND